MAIFGFGLKKFEKESLGARCVVDDARMVSLPGGGRAMRVSFWQYNEAGEREVRKTTLLKDEHAGVGVGFECTLGDLMEMAIDIMKAQQAANASRQTFEAKGSVVTFDTYDRGEGSEATSDTSEGMEKA